MTWVGVIESDAAIRQVVQLLFEDAGYVVVEANDGLSGLALLQSGVDPLVTVIDQRLPRLDGAEAYGFRGQVWTCRQVAEVIRYTFGVAYHPAHVSRLLHAVRHSVQQPIVRAIQRDAAAIRAWWQERWPALEKRRPRRGALSSG